MVPILELVKQSLIHSYYPIYFNNEMIKIDLLIYNEHIHTLTKDF